MLRKLLLSGVGPAAKMEATFAPRFNVLTGDNGLGKSFLLDVAWWALTRTWPSTPAIPLERKQAASIYCELKGKTRATTLRSQFDFKRQIWPVEAKRPTMPGVVVYARVDGGFSVWDPKQNYFKEGDPSRPTAYHFDKDQVWEGLIVDGLKRSEGLDRDWVGWQRGQQPEFQWLEAALTALSPPDEPIVPGEPRRLLLGEGRDRPTIVMNGQETPILVASAAVKRVLALSYFLVWAWSEHCKAADIRREDPDRRLVLLFDEPETHLHPRWQRRILPATLEAADSLRGKGAETQIIVATHSPLVLASMEPVFDWEKDGWLDLDFEKPRVALRQRDFVRHGDVSNWLTSEAFDLKSARSLPAEAAIEKARALLRQPSATLNEAKEIDAELRKAALPDIDPFWVRWSYFVETLGSKP